MSRQADRFFLPQLRSMGEVLSWAANMVRTTGIALAQLARQIAAVLPKDGSEPMGAPLPLHSVTVATLPAAADWEGAVVYVSDGASGARFRGSNGSAWVNLG